MIKSILCGRIPLAFALPRVLKAVQVYAPPSVRLNKTEISTRSILSAVHCK